MWMMLLHVNLNVDDDDLEFENIMPQQYMTAFLTIFAGILLF